MNVQSALREGAALARGLVAASAENTSRAVMVVKVFIAALESIIYRVAGGSADL